LVLKQGSLQGAEEVLCLGEGPPERLHAVVVFIAGDHIRDDLFLTLIAAHDALKFDMHTGAAPGSRDR
jgi:hypothetical protein